ncbi:MAG: DNA-binding response regulator [Flavobacteriaceae bacterium]|nr:DNA-binding response regulator [Flavobacteriaceae bacterium]|tara:strand:+ start:1354 stop:1989 length:636 start_codon:yes stop_codon:yes gene_type:complete
MIRVYVADAHPIVHKGLKAVFRNSNEIRIVGKGLYYRDLVDYLQSKKVDIVVLEIELPGFEEIRTLRRLKDQYTKVSFLVFTALSEEIYAMSALKYGASGFLCKDNPLNKIKDAILKISTGGVYITNELAEHMAFNETGANPRALINQLSEREIQVLRLLVNGKRNKEIAISFSISDKTVSTYRSRLMKKLKVKNLVEMLNKLQHIDLDMY